MNDMNLHEITNIKIEQVDTLEEVMENLLLQDILFLKVKKEVHLE